jgi:hypothetical protein
MSWLRAVSRLVAETVRYSLATRRSSLLLVVILGLLLLALAIVAQLATPLALYPFA